MLKSIILTGFLLFFSTNLFADQGITNDEILIGMHTDLSGPISMVGNQSSDGAKMRFEEFNKNGGAYGRKIKFIVEDHQYTVPRAVQAANKLLRKDKVAILLGSLGTPQNNAVLTDQLNLNVPNLEVEEMKGWVATEVGTDLIRQMTEVDIEPKVGHEGSFHLKLKWGERIPPTSIETDVGAVANGYVSLTWLSRLQAGECPTNSSIENKFDSIWAI